MESLGLNGITDQTIAKAAEAIALINKDGSLRKAAVDLATGFTGVNLEAPAKLLVPQLSPFRQSIGRVTKGGGQTSWKRITAVTPTTGFYPAEGAKANAFALTTDNPSATFRSYGRLGDVTWEAEVAGRNFEDARARAEAILLLQVLKEEELAILGGNRTALAGGSAGTGPTAVAVPNAGGSLADDQWFVRVKALTLEGIARASKINRPIAGNVYDLAADGVPTLDISVGATASGTEDDATTATTNNSIKLTFTPVAGAAGYAIYVGQTTGAANCTLVAIVTQTEMVINTLPALTGATAAGSDTSVNAASFDGIIAQLMASGSGAYKKALTAPLSAAVGHNIPELATMVQDIYDRTKVEPDRLLCGWQEANQIDALMAAVANDRINIVYQAQEGGPIFKPFTHITSPVSGKAIRVESNPNMPGGMILALIDGVPYQNSAIPAAWQMHFGSDMTRLDYALTAPKAEFEIRAFGCLAGYAPALQGVLYDIHRF